MPKIIITGGLGFIFSHVTEYFVKKGWDVIVIDNQGIGSHPEIIDGSFAYYNNNVEECEELIKEINPEYIIHAAAISDVDYSISHPRETINKNCNATLAVFEAARKCTNLKKLLYVSTDEVYGECEYPKQESDIIFPKNPYSMSKAYGSLLRIAYDNTYQELKNKTCETRFCNVFGERQDPRKILGRIVQSFKDKTPIPVHNGGKGKREYIYVKNIPPIVEKILIEGDRVYNITLNSLLSVNQLIEIAEEVAGKKLNKKPSDRPGMDQIYQMDNSRVFEFGWKPEYPLGEGLTSYFKNEKII